MAEAQDLPHDTFSPAGSPGAGEEPRRIGTWEWDIAADEVTWSDELYRLWDLPPDRGPITYEDWLQRHHPDDRAAAAAAIQQALHDHRPFTLQSRIILPDGSVRLVLVNGRVVVGRDGQALRMLGTAEDVTAPSERLLGRRLVRIAESITDAMVVLDQEWRYVYINRNAELILGRPRTELLGRETWETAPFSRERVGAAKLRRAMSERVAVTWEEFSPLFGRWIEVRAYPYDEGLAIYFLDLTGRRRLEQELMEQADRIRQICENVREVLWLTDPDLTRIYYVSPAYETLWGRSIESVHADPWSFLEGVHPDDRARVAAACAPERYITGYDLEYRLVRPDGTVRWVRDRAFPIYSAQGTIYRVAAVTADVTVRKEAELEREQLVEALEEERIRLHAIIDSMPAGLVIAEAPSGRITLSNAAADRIYGGSAPPPARIAEYARYRGFHPGSGLPYRADQWPLARSITTGEVVQGEEVLWERDDGSRVEIRINSAPVRDSGGHVTAAVAIFEDVTEERRAERLVQGQEQVLELVAGGAPLAEVLGAAARLAEEQSGAACAIFQLADGNRLALRAEAGLPPDVRAALDGIEADERAGLLAASAARRVFVAAPDLATAPDAGAAGATAAANGLHGYWSAPLLDRNGQLLGALALFRTTPDEPTPRDVEILEAMVHLATIALAREQADAALRESEERFRLAARATEDVIYDWDIPTATSTWGDGAAATLRYPPEELQNSFAWWTERIHEEDRQRVLDSLDATLQAPPRSGPAEGWSEEYRFRRGDGTWGIFLDRGYLVRGADGRAVRMIGSMIDLTERTRLQDRLRQAQKMEAVGQLAGGIAHDFNNLLTAIRGSAEFVLAAHQEDAAIRPDLEEILHSADRAASLTRQLLAFSRRQVIQPQILELNGVVAETEKMLRRVIGEDITLVTNLAPDVGQVRMDRGQLQQILLNLAINARDAMPEGGALMIETAEAVLQPRPGRRQSDTAQGPHLRLTVHDTGTGMDEATRARIFEPFFTTKPVGQGSGLGLSTVYGIVRQCGGRIAVHSEPGRGTTFDLFLPRYLGHGEAAAAAPPTAAPGVEGNGTILLVEDDRAVRAVVRRVLQARGFRVLEARNGREALQLVAEEAGPIDLVVSDVVMPEMGGRELIDHLAVQRPGLKVLLMSGYAQGTKMKEELPPHVAFIEKPFVVADLLARIGELVARRA